MKQASCRVFDVVILMGAVALSFCIIIGFIFEAYLATKGVPIPDTLSRASAASLGAMIVILTTAFQRRYHINDEAENLQSTPSNDERQSSKS
jgi:hypothetical protein